MADKLETEEQPGACLHMLHVRPRLREQERCFKCARTSLLAANKTTAYQVHWGIHKV